MIHGTTRIRDRQQPGKGLNTGEERQQPLVIHVRYCRATFLLWGIGMAGIADALSEDGNGIIIAVEVTAGGKRAVFPDGYNAWRKMIGCRVSAPAIEGRANRAVIELVAGTLGRPVASVSIVSGATSSHKRLHIAGISKEEVLNLLDKSPL